MRFPLLSGLTALALAACSSGSDYDGDGVTSDVDCDDFNESVAGPIDWFQDEDGDGYGDPDQVQNACERPAGYVSRAGDCDVDDPGVNPGAEESCNGADDDCDGFTDENTDKGVWFADLDGDGFGDPESATEACDGSGGFVANDRDCNDGDGAIRPGADELCDDVDNDCDGRIDEPDAADATDWYLDTDADGFGQTSSMIRSCDAPSPAWADAGNDCDDDDLAINPGADELCDGFDNNCDGLIDDPSATDATAWYVDGDGDGYGDDENSILACTQVEGTVATAGDCDDRDRFRSPATLWFLDDDGDGYGNVEASLAGCDDPSDGSATYVDNFRDCDDANADTNPMGSEVCDGVDNDCDGTADGADAADATTFYMDFDDDGFGSPDRVGRACSRPDGFTTDNGDCDDDNAYIYPGADEFCDDLDNDCDGLIDYADPDAVVLTWHQDADKDGYGSPTITLDDCEQPDGYIKDDTDCDDANFDVNPGAIEVCDAGLDNDCDGLVDGADPDMAGDGTWYRDYDGDGYGDRDITVTSCSEPTGYVRNDDDCDDSDGAKWNTCWIGPRTFTPCGATGHAGPAQADCNTAYSGTNLDGEVTVTDGIQEWVVPQDGTYEIEVWGAEGASGNGSRTGGPGARMRGEFDLSEGDVLFIAVGQEGIGISGSNGGGGGGSFVVDESDDPLIIAGGGGGTRTGAGMDGCPGRVSEYAGTGVNTSTHTCTAKTTALGSGGDWATTWYGSGGAGFRGDGGSDPDGLNCAGDCGGKSWSNGMGGGYATASSADGGFGGGGAGNGDYGGGGGGGYSGGDAGYIAGAGGSFNDGDNPSNTEGVQTGDGEVVIDFLSP